MTSVNAISAIGIYKYVECMGGDWWLLIRQREMGGDEFVQCLKIKGLSDRKATIPILIFYTSLIEIQYFFHIFAS